MRTDKEFMSHLLRFLVELLEIPPSHYKLAAGRYRSLGEWLCRTESTVAALFPEVYPQGSFRYGTVIRPLLKNEEYDLDLVCQLVLAKARVTQQRLKYLVGDEIKAYAEAHSFNEPAEEKHRCWRLNYADGVSFHMDILPCIPQDAAFFAWLAKLGVPAHLAATAVAITDDRHPKYKEIDPDWPSSNPRGFATWFEGRMRQVATPRLQRLVEQRVYASVDEVPAYEWKTPLQRSIQILKRHRDVMFRDSPEWRPLSMIITTLSAHAYSGEANLYEALANIIDEMPKHVRSTQPRIPNPVNPAEDFADRWASDARYERNFWLWHRQVKVDVEQLRGLVGNASETARVVRVRFAADLTVDMQRKLSATVAAPPQPVMPVPVVHIASAPRPWRRNA